MSTLYQTITPLTDEQRIDARERAAKIVLKSVGDKPQRAQFANTSISKYPAWFTRFIGGLIAVVFVAAAMPSLFRLFSAGRDYFLTGINDHWQAAVVGVSTFLLSEFLIVLSTIAARVYFTGRSRFIFIIPVVMGLLMALVGNWTVVKPHDVFSFLEAVIPVFAVLFIAFIGERIILEALETRHANERAYQEALHSWQVASGTPEQHPRYMSALANALRDSLKSANEQGAGATQRKALMSAFTVEHWKPLVWREMQADQWYAADTGAFAELPALPVLPETTTPQRRKKADEVEAVLIEPRPFGPTAPDAGEHEFTPIMQPGTENASNGSVNGNGHHS
jgi:hypothetical protein